MGDIYILSSHKTGKEHRKKLVSIRNVQSSIGDVPVSQLLVVHALSGCDTTSALFGQGKCTAFNKWTRNQTALPLTDVLSSYTATQEEVAQAGS